jgi:protein-S-isoprenylcysteine O-methyltransferase Ste14
VSQVVGNSAVGSEPTRPPIRATFFARWRVRFGYLLAIVVLLLAHPTPWSIAIGGALGLIGLWVRALAAGHLHKQEMLTVSGPYAHTRNPLYFGSAILTLGAAVAMNSWIAAALLCGYFALFYSVVMRKEEGELRFHHGAAFNEYAKSVPLFFPRVTAARLEPGTAGAFSFSQYKKNREYRAAIGFLLLLVLLVVEWRVRLGH